MYGEPIENDGIIKSARVMKSDTASLMDLEPLDVVRKVDEILAPVSDPPICLMIGLNYKAHAAEAGLPLPPFPIMFTKPANACNNNTEIIVPTICQNNQTDYEVELAVVLSRDCKNVTKDQALDYVAGYLVANDVSARKWQKGSQWTFSKSFDGWLPLSNVLVSRRVIPDDPGKVPLKMSTKLNGQTVQDSVTNDMIFSVSHLISFLSQGTTLQANTVICTGTPEGVGFARSPAVYLQHGDQLEMSIEKIGTLRNVVRFE
jgi:2-keto-4-pentenoate hydratase/2-oxohepta-3-ene-1,7-dioic acid hydratase in catechol pathway